MISSVGALGNGSKTTGTAGNVHPSATFDENFRLFEHQKNPLLET